MKYFLFQNYLEAKRQFGLKTGISTVSLFTGYKSRFIVNHRQTLNPSQVNKNVANNSQYVV